MGLSRSEPQANEGEEKKVFVVVVGIARTQVARICSLEAVNVGIMLYLLSMCSLTRLIVVCLARSLAHTIVAPSAGGTQNQSHFVLVEAAVAERIHEAKHVRHGGHLAGRHVDAP